MLKYRTSNNYRRYPLAEVLAASLTHGSSLLPVNHFENRVFAMMSLMHGGTGLFLCSLHGPAPQRAVQKSSAVEVTEARALQRVLPLRAPVRQGVLRVPDGHLLLAHGRGHGPGQRAQPGRPALHVARLLALSGVSKRCQQQGGAGGGVCAVMPTCCCLCRQDGALLGCWQHSGREQSVETYLATGVVCVDAESLPGRCCRGTLLWQASRGACITPAGACCVTMQPRDAARGRRFRAHLTTMAELFIHF